MELSQNPHTLNIVSNGAIEQHKNTENNSIFKDLSKEMISEFEALNNTDSIGLFVTKTANDWINEAKTQPDAKMLFGALWFENEVSILFADSNNGKSVLATQIADSISKGYSISGFKNETEKQCVLYFDFELSARQFTKRYSIENKEHYIFDNNFKRSQINPEFLEYDNGLEEIVLPYIENEVARHGAKVIVIDNITYLGNENDKSKNALKLMKGLKQLKNKIDISILVIAHTTKRNQSNPIIQNDVAGSKMLMNFCDSSFAIGKSSIDSNIRYLKQIKVRDSAFAYDSENVALCTMEKVHNFLSFNFIGFGDEKDHLKEFTGEAKSELIQQVKELKSKGRTVRDISIELGISTGCVSNYLNKHSDNSDF